MTELSRTQVLAYRLWVNHLAGERFPAADLVRAAAAGLQDSAPRSAVLSLAARVEGVRPDDWKAPGLTQVYGPRGAIYVVPTRDVAVFTLGLLPRDPERVARLRDIAAAAIDVLSGEPMRQRDLGELLRDVDANRELRWAACLGTLRPVWDAVDTIVHPAPEPEMEVDTARLELARRFFRYLGPATRENFRWWIAGERSDAAATVTALGDELASVNVGGRACFILSATLPHLGDATSPIDPDLVHLLPPDDTYINRRTREVLLPDPALRQVLWPKAPPPGALVIGGEVAGTWRRRGGRVEVETWGTVAAKHVERAEEIASRWPLGHEVEVVWKQRSR